MATNWKLVMKGVLADGAETRNIFYFTTSNTDVEAATTIEAWFEEMVSLMQPAMSTQDHLVGYDLYKWSGTDWSLQVENTEIYPGTRAGDVLPNQVSPVLIARTPHKRTIGRKSLMRSTVTAISSGDWTNAFITILAGILSFWIADFTSMGATINPGIWRRAAAVMEPIIGGWVDWVPGSQRRRKENVGV